MLFRSPELGAEEERVLDQIREIWRTLKFQLQHEPRRWQGFLRRSALARGIRGSNSIEGYLVSDDDAMAAVDGDEPFEASSETWKAILGYREAMTYVLRIGDDPHASVDSSLIRALHYMMIGYDIKKHPGSWRPGPIWVDDSDGNKVYEAPDVHLVPELMGELVSWINSDDGSSSMIRAAMAHLNLVMIHPFSDGNGRMGRCLQTLVLARAGIYDPVFCSVEEYLGANTQAYYKACQIVGGGKWKPNRDARPWIRLMLTAHYRQAGTFMRRLRETGLIWGAIEEILNKHGIRDRATPSVVEAAFGFRIRNQGYRSHADVTSNQASRDLAKLVSAGLLVTKGEKRGRWYERSPALLEVRDRFREAKPISDPFGRPT